MRLAFVSDASPGVDSGGYLICFFFLGFCCYGGDGAPKLATSPSPFPLIEFLTCMQVDCSSFRYAEDLNIRQ